MDRSGPFLSLVAAMLALSLWGGTVASAQPQGPAPAFPPTDIVVALDQSGSLRGTDPKGARIDAVKMLIRTLGLYVGAADVRFGLVEFGSPLASPSVPQLTLPLARLNVSSPQWMQQQIRAQVLPGTDFSSALCLSWLAVTSAKLPPEVDCRIPPAELAKVSLSAPGEGRRRVVILFTDGLPAPDGKRELNFASSDPGPACDTAQASASPGHVYMCTLASFWAELMHSASVDLYVIGLDAKRRWWPIVEPYWRTITQCGAQCRLRVTRASDSARLVEQILEAGITPRGSYLELCKDANCKVDPLVSETSFIIYGSSADNRVLQPSGAELVPDATRIFRNRGEGVDVWHVRSPQPGLWKVQSRDPKATLRILNILTPVRLLLQTDPDRPTVGEPFAVKTKMVDREGNSVEIAPVPNSTPFELTLRITGPGDERQVRDVAGSLNPASDYRFEPPIKLERPGSYHLEAALTRDIRFAVGELTINVDEPLLPRLSLVLTNSGNLFLTEAPTLDIAYPLVFSKARTIQFEVALMDGRSNLPTPPERQFVGVPQVTLVFKVVPPVLMKCV